MSFRLLPGPCVIENPDLVLQAAEEVSKLCSKLGIELIYKSVLVWSKGTPWKDQLDELNDLDWN